MKEDEELKKKILREILSFSRFFFPKNSVIPWRFLQLLRGDLQFLSSRHSPEVVSLQPHTSKVVELQWKGQDL